jgi:hypothetical protein
MKRSRVVVVGRIIEIVDTVTTIMKIIMGRLFIFL